MKIYEYKPEFKDADGNLVLDGVIKCKLPDWKSKQALKQAMKNWKEDETETKLIEMVEQFIDSIDLTLTVTGEKIDTFDELMYYQEGAVAVIRLSEVIGGGIPLGLGLKQLSASR